jgi:hypothetical protein
MGRVMRTKEELLAASIHLHYEYWMLISLANAMSTGIFGKERLNNALVESFTIHTRIILDFLYSEEPRNDDVVAEDYIDPGEWHKLRTQKSLLLQGVHKRVGKEIAHLTYSRQQVTDEDKKWPFLQIANEINVVFQQFLSTVNRDLLGSNWK